MFRTLIFILLFALSGCSAIAELETKTEAKEAKKKALEFLVGKGIDDINAKNSWREKETLHDGEDEWEPEIAKALIVVGANVNIKDNYGETPFYRAKAYGNLDVVQILKDAGGGRE